MQLSNCRKGLGRFILLVICLALGASFLVGACLDGMVGTAAAQSTTERYIPLVKSKSVLMKRVELDNPRDSAVSVRVYAVDGAGESSEPLGGEIILDPFGKWIVEDHEIPATAAFLKVESPGNIRVTSVLANRAGTKSESITATGVATTVDFSFFGPLDAGHGILYLVNPNPVPTALEFTAYNTAGVEIGTANLPTFNAYASLAIPLRDLFGAGVPKSLTTLRMTATEAMGGFRLSNYPGGDLVGLPAESAASTCWEFSVPGRLHALGLRTSIGVLNVGTEVATLNIEFLDKEGASVGTVADVSLDPDATVFIGTGRAITIPSSAVRVKIGSTQPSKGFQLTRTLKGHGLAAALGIPCHDLQALAGRFTGAVDGNTLNAVVGPRAQAAIAPNAAGFITVTAPNGGQVWGAGSTRTITWTTTGDAGSRVNIDLYKGNPETGLSWKGTIASNLWVGTGSFTWLVWYNVESGKDYYVRVRSNTGVEDLSDAPFTLRKSLITVTSPAGGENWEINTPQNIQWTYTGNPGTTVTIDLYKKGSWMGTVANGIPIGTSNAGSLLWTVWPTLARGVDYKMRVTSNRSIEDYSDRNFTLSPSGVTVTLPNAAGIVWKRGSRNTIAWSHKTDAGTYVTIDLYKGDSWMGTIASNVNIGATKGTYLWTIPSGVAAGTDYKIRVTSDLGYTDYSNNPFTIEGTGITVTSPDFPPPTVTAGRTLSISWTYEPFAGKRVTVDLYRGESWQGTIASGVSIGSGGVGSMNWLIPSGTAAATDYRIRLTTDLSFTDYSDYAFEIAPTGFTVLSPNGGTYQRNGFLTVTWTVEDFIIGDYVTIDLYKGESWWGTIGNGFWIGSGATGFTWLIPSDIELGSDYRIRATTEQGVTDYTDNTFTIAP